MHGPASARQSVYAATGDTTSVSGRAAVVRAGAARAVLSVDTACSSALVALHSGALAIRIGECRSAVASAVGLKLAPLVTLGVRPGGMLSVDGRCKTWDKGANGYVRSEGVGSTVLRAVSDGASGALALSGSAVRQDGRSASLTAPNGSAQRGLLVAAMAVAGLEASAVGGVEAHGTGTALGDPTEAGSMAAAYCAGRASVLAVGAAKAGIGHAEAASGMAGLCKVAQQLLRSAVAGNTKLRVLNPLVRERLGAGGAAALPSQPLASAGGACGLSSFGYSGSIAHMMLSAVGSSLALATPRPLRLLHRAFPWEAHTGAATAPPRVGLYHVDWTAVPLPVTSGHLLGRLCLLLPPDASAGADAMGKLQLGDTKILQMGQMLDGSAESALTSDALALVLEGNGCSEPAVPGVCTLLDLAQLLLPMASPPALVVVTHGACVPLGERGGSAAVLGGAAHGGACGFGRVLRLERAAQPMVNVDVSGGTLHDALQQLRPMLTSVVVAPSMQAREGEWVVRSRAWCVPRLRQHEAVGREKPVQLRGALVITGGLGGLGLRAAKALSGGTHAIVLASRSGKVARDGQGLDDALAALQQATSRVRCLAADASAVDQVKHMTHVSGEPLGGVLHAAGVLRDRLVANASASDLHTVFGPKAGGAWHLHNATAMQPLDMMVYYSSVTACHGTIGQMSYAAANTYMDSLARCRHECGAAARSLQFPLVGGMGMGAATFNTEQISKLESFTLDEYAACLCAAIRGTLPVLALMHWDSEQFIRSVPAKLTFFDELRPAKTAEGVAPEQSSNPLVAALTALEPSKRQPHVEALVLKVVHDVGGSDGVIVASTPLMEAGIDSLAATELAIRLREATGLALSPTLVFERPTPRAIAAHVLEELLGHSWRCQ